MLQGGVAVTGTGGGSRTVTIAGTLDGAGVSARDGRQRENRVERAARSDHEGLSLPDPERPGSGPARQRSRSLQACTTVRIPSGARPGRHRNHRDRCHNDRRPYRSVAANTPRIPAACGSCLPTACFRPQWSRKQRWRRRSHGARSAGRLTCIGVLRLRALTQATGPAIDSRPPRAIWRTSRHCSSPTAASPATAVQGQRSLLAQVAHALARARPESRGRADRACPNCRTRAGRRCMAVVQR